MEIALSQESSAEQQLKQIQQQKEEALSQQRQLEEQRRAILNPQKRAGFTPRQQRTQQQSFISQTEQPLQSLKSYASQLSLQEKQLQEYQKQQRDYNYGVELAKQGYPGYFLKGEQLRGFTDALGVSSTLKGGGAFGQAQFRQIQAEQGTKEEFNLKQDLIERGKAVGLTISPYVNLSKVQDMVLASEKEYNQAADKYNKALQDFMKNQDIPSAIKTRFQEFKAQFPSIKDFELRPAVKREIAKVQTEFKNFNDYLIKKKIGIPNAPAYSTDILFKQSGISTVPKLDIQAASQQRLELRQPIQTQINKLNEYLTKKGFKESKPFDTEDFIGKVSSKEPQGILAFRNILFKQEETTAIKGTPRTLTKTTREVPRKYLTEIKKIFQIDRINATLSREHQLNPERVKSYIENIWYKEVQTIERENGTLNLKTKKVSRLGDLVNDVLSKVKGQIRQDTINNKVQKFSVFEEWAFDTLTPEQKKGYTKAMEIAAIAAIPEAVLFRLGLADEIGVVRTAKAALNNIALFKPEVLTTIPNKIANLIPSDTPQQQMIKGLAEGYIPTAISPRLGLAYASELGQGLLFNTRETIESTKKFAEEKPFELAGMLVGGSKKFATSVESEARKAMGTPEFKVDIVYVDNPAFASKPTGSFLELLTPVKDKGKVPVKIIETAKYGKVAFIEGEFAQSFQVKAIQQLKEAQGINYFVNVHAGSVPFKKAGKGSGFEVIEVDKPKRGYYENPHLTKKYAAELHSQAAVLSYYLGMNRGERILPNIPEIVDLMTGKAELGEGRAMAIVRRAKAYPTESWVKDITVSMETGKKVSKTVQSKVNYYYNKFLKEPYKWEGKEYVGKEKADLIISKNLAGRNKGKFSDKVFIALTQYQHEQRVLLHGGAEVLSGELPYGAEYQDILALGTKVYRRSLADLRKAKKVGVGESILTLLTGKQRGQAFAEVEGNLLEFEYVRAFPKRIKEVSTKKIPKEVKETPVQSITSLITRRAEERIKIPKVKVKAIPIRRENERMKNVNDLLTRREPSRERERLPRRAEERIREPRREERERQREREPLRDILIRRPRREERERQQPRRPEPRRPERRRLDEIIPRNIFTRDEGRGRKKIKKKPLGKQRGFLLTPTLTQQISGERRKKPLRLSQLTGFERIIT